MTFGDAFLTSPERFAGPPSIPWGSETLVVDFPGGSYQFSGLASAQAAWVRARYRSDLDLASRSSAPITTQVNRLPQHAFQEIDTRGWEYSFDREYQAGELRLSGQDFVAQIRFAGGLSGGLWTSRADPEHFSGVFENFFRVLVAYRIAQRGGVLLHSAAFARDGWAQVLFGRSGAGKSTSARLALEAGWEVLSDDMNALLPGPAGWRVHQIPFTGDLGQTDSRGGNYPIGGLHWLQQSATHGVRPLPQSLALARLLACAPILNEDPHRVEDLLRNLTDLLAHAGAGTLDFACDPGFLALLETDVELRHAG